MDDEKIDGKIQDLFGDFDPPMAPDAGFMAALERNMEAVEIVRQHTLAVRRRSRVAALLAALAGFAAGVLFTLLWPLAGDWVSTIHFSAPHLGIETVSVDYTLLAWILTVVLSGATALNTYEIAMSTLSTPVSVDNVDK